MEKLNRKALDRELDPEKCAVCDIREKGWCRPLKRYQCKSGIDNEEFIHFLICELSEKHRMLMVADLSRGKDNKFLSKTFYDEVEATQAARRREATV